MKLLNKSKPHVLAIVAILILNAIYFYPAFTGKTLEQDDIQLGQAKSKELREYRADKGEEALWTNSMFGGMPTFQINTQYPNNIFESLERPLKLWLPAQIGLIFFLMFGFYILLSSFKVNPWVSLIGAIAFGFSAFFIISFDAGHNAKLRAAGYMAPMLMGILLTFRGKRWLGLAFTALFAGMAISANHIQVTYYATLVAVIIAIVELVNAIKKSNIPAYLKSVGVLAIAGALALGPNVSKLWTTYEYSQETIRGGGSGLKAENEGKNGLDKDYAMSWSYGVTETLNLIVPNIMGGGASQNYEGTETHNQYFQNIKSNLVQQGYGSSQAETLANRQIAGLMYWGDQSMVNGANYLGASVFFLFILGLFLIKDRRRTWIVASVILAIFMAWGKNFSAFNDFLFEHLPLYNKFRVPSMTLVIVFLLMPLMGMFALDFIIKQRDEQKEFIKKSLLNSFYIAGGLFLVLALIGPALFEFSGANDERLAQNPQLLDLLIEDRKDLARSSAFRSFAFALVAFGILYLFLLNTLKRNVVLVAMGGLVLIDLWSFDKQHLNSEDFVEDKEYTASYQPSVADRSILQDQGYYRVFNLQNPFNDALTSYHHKSVGGYHGAKLQRYQELYEEVLFGEQQRIVQNLQKNRGQGMEAVFQQTPVLNMMNAKYVIYNPQAQAIQNPYANGGAWFVKQLALKNTAREVVDALKTMNTDSMAVVHQKFAEYAKPANYSGEGQIELTNYDPKTMTYSSNSSSEQFAVFSEIYYRGEEGDWQAYIDDEPARHIRVNYVLRGMKIPAGEHEIVFKFRPKSYYAGETISLTSSIILVLVVLLSLFLYFRKHPELLKQK